MKAILILAGAALAFAAPATAQELVTNGGFETGNFSGFTQFGNTGFTSVNSGAAFTGSRGAEFGPVGSVGGITQSVLTTAGQTYSISFDLAGGTGEGVGANFYNVLFGATSLFSASNAAPFGYTHFSTTAVAAGASTLLSFNFRNDPDFFRLDNVSVMAVRGTGAVPEPATWAMMLIGFGAIGVSLRRRCGAIALAA